MRNPLLTLTFGSLAFVGAGACHGAIVVNDTFDVGASPTIGNDADDPLDIAWTGSGASVSRGTAVGGSPGSGAYLSLANGNFAQASGTLPTSGLVLSNIGDRLIFTGLVNFTGSGDLSANSGTGVTFRLLNSAGRGPALNAGTGGNTTLSIANRSVTANTGDVATNGSMSSTTAVNTVYGWSLSIERTSASLITYTAAFNGGTASFVDTDNAADGNDYITSYNGGSLVMGNAASGNSKAARFDNIKVEYVPEPGLISLLALATVPLARRRRA